MYWRGISSRSTAAQRHQLHAHNLHTYVYLSVGGVDLFCVRVMMVT